MGADTQAQGSPLDVVTMPVDTVAVSEPLDAPDLDPTAPATDYVPGHALLAPAAAIPGTVETTLLSGSDDKAPVEGKVWSATIGAGAGTAVSTLVLWLLGVLVWHAPAAAGSAVEAVAAVPSPVAAVVGVGVPAAAAFVAGYVAKHTPR